MDRMNERFAPNMVKVPFRRLEQLLKTEALAEAMLAEFDRSEYHTISKETVINAKSVIWGEDYCAEVYKANA